MALHFSRASPVSPLPRSTYGALTAAYPRNTTRASATWFLDDWETTLRASRYSWTRTYSDRGAAYDEVVRPAYIFDLDVTYAVTKTLKASIGGNNIFDKRPETLSALAQAASPIYQTNPSYSSASIYGSEGGYYYARLTYTW
ncbi:TonB-dependent receptor [Nitrospirillum iridis]|uniref:Outer membrane receptor protein involved in Fe transport n=1 Tax=Nitrospirillum iridis TaxID=765888 RepID=A0A7X0EHM9_9PROT|nr:TonB-dependent receptor [Nitrospirillum iridis]MBB6255301.1 outer membrane receptor protein involved in Fe transport [Nitrospirillum iridis]